MIIYHEKGITLIVLVVTIVILIILATISVNLVINGGLFSKTESSVELHKREAAKEKLSLALGSASLEKRMNSKYNQDNFLDGLILKEIPDAKILGNVVVVEVYGFVIDSYTYDNKKEEIVENYTVNRNGSYVIKVYSELSRTEMIEINELVANMKYSPNGSKEYKKEHTVQVSVDKTVDKLTSIKYQWTDTTEEPEETSFTKSCTDGEKITKNEVTGSWYLWTLIL